jgi:hypothetical protein
LLVTYLVYKFVKGTRFQRARTMDINFGMREYFPSEVVQASAKDEKTGDLC